MNTSTEEIRAFVDFEHRKRSLLRQCFRSLVGAVKRSPPALAVIAENLTGANVVNQREPAAFRPSHARTVDLPRSNTTTQPQLLTLEEAANRLSISQTKLRRLCRERKITHQRVDYRNYRFRQRDLEEFEMAKTFKRKGALWD
jgi:excisionase family DNA binding protein